MATLNQLARVALAFPGVTEFDRRGARTWAVGKKVFAWERPLNKADIKRYGDVLPPTGEIAAVRLADMGEREAVLGERRPGVFVMEHFANYPAVLLQLSAISAADLRSLVLDGWLVAATPARAERYLATHRSARRAT